MIRKCVFFPIVTVSEFPIYGHSRESRRRRCYEIGSPGAIATPEFQAMRGSYQFAPHVRSHTQVILLAS
jgi:hypothetical protein